MLGKKDEIVVGPDDADLVVTIAQADLGLDPTVAFMQGKLKAPGSTGQLFELLRVGRGRRGARLNQRASALVARGSRSAPRRPVELGRARSLPAVTSA